MRRGGDEKELKHRCIQEKGGGIENEERKRKKKATYLNMGDENADISSHGLFQCVLSSRFKVQYSTLGAHTHTVQCTINMSSQFSLKLVKWNHACITRIHTE